ncbi:phosphoglycerate mutase [Rothia sp. HMSC067H10]|nr:phosphoglycerate mutase [Rothia sp. HMSC067H10]
MTDAQTHHEHAETPGKIFLLRHGQTDWNINHRFQGRTDIPLNDTGREQIRGAVPQLREMAQRGVQIDGVVSSPLERAAESGRIVARELGVPYLGAYAGLEERSFGDLEGEAATPELVAASRTDGHKYGVEEREALVSRALTALNRVRREHEGKNIVVATHGMLIAVTMTVLLEGREHEGYETIDGMFPIPPNASLTELPTDFLDDAIDAHVLVNRQPKLHAEPFPKNLAGGSLTLIRHGQTEWNKNQLMQGISDIPLNETGRQQAHETGAKLQQMGLRYDRVLSSPLSRAHETAQRVGEFFGLTVSQTYPELVERAYGAAEGKNIPDYESDAPDRFYPGVETERDLYVRAVRALREVVRQYPGERLMVVSHGSLIRRAISAAQGYEHTQEVPNAQPLEVDIAGLFAFDENTVFDERGRLVW